MESFESMSKNGKANSSAAQQVEKESSALPKAGAQATPAPGGKMPDGATSTKSAAENGKATAPAAASAPAKNAKAAAKAAQPAVKEPKAPKLSKPAASSGVDMSISFAGIELRNPVLAASGTFGYGIEFEEIVSLDKLGGFVVKGLSREPLAGNPPPRLFETPAGMVNAIGLQNIGVEAFLREKLPLLNKLKGTAVIVNVFGHTIPDYEAVIRALNEGPGIAAYELNVSCPNVKHGGMTFGQDPVMLSEVVSAAKSVSTRPLIVKLSPNVTSIAQMAVAAANAGADVLSLVNTFTALAIDPETRKPRLANVTGGLSGPAIKPIALRMVYEAAHAVDIPVIGLGGIGKAEDVVEFLLAGAAAVQVGTANFWDPCACEKIVSGLERWCLEHHVARITDLIGGLILE
jgi:dihydroorotate dehydrogenase (NAD+) catalytic subunit